MEITSHSGSKEQYLHYLDSYLNKREYPCPYVDPDGTYCWNNWGFYEKLVAFLNLREAKFSAELGEPWEYIHIGEYSPGNTIPPGICVRTKDGQQTRCYLRSDQFGFSAPYGEYPQGSNAWDDPRYPYAKLLQCSSCGDRMQFVADCVCSTRTVGGSFLWPLQKEGVKWKSNYNMNRGVGSYIQDRVDLTLFEVKHYYEHKKRKGRGRFSADYEWQDDKLYTELVKNPYMQVWLDHFGSFEPFVEFFMLDNFVDQETYMPKSIVTGKPLTERDVNNIKSMKGEIHDLTVEQVKNMLGNVSAWILERSGRMEELL